MEWTGTSTKSKKIEDEDTQPKQIRCRTARTRCFSPGCNELGLSDTKTTVQSEDHPISKLHRDRNSMSKDYQAYKLVENTDLKIEKSKDNPIPRNFKLQIQPRLRIELKKEPSLKNDIQFSITNQNSTANRLINDDINGIKSEIKRDYGIPHYNILDFRIENRRETLAGYLNKNNDDRKPLQKKIQSSRAITSNIKQPGLQVGNFVVPKIYEFTENKPIQRPSFPPRPKSSYNKL